MQHDDRQPSTSAAASEPPHASTRSTEDSPPAATHDNDGFPYLWMAVTDCPFPMTACIAIMRSLTRRTKIQYELYLARWWEFALERRADPHHLAEADIICFLDSLTHVGKGYSALNAAKSAILFVLSLRNEQLPEMTHLKKYMKGQAAMKPPSSKSALVWNPQMVLDYFNAGPHNSEMDLPDLTWKITMLLALATGQRTQTLQAIDLDHMSSTPDNYSINIATRMKQTFGGRPAPSLFIPKLDSAPKIR